MFKLKDVGFLKELDALQRALADHRITKAEEDSINAKIQELIRRQKEELLKEEKKDV